MSLVQDIAILQKVPMLSDFSDDQLRLLAFSAEALDYRNGQILFDETERADGGMVIASGDVSLQKSKDGDFEEVDMAGPGTLLGETAMLVDARRPCRAVAVGGVRVIRIRRALFKRMIQEYPDLARRLFEQHANRYQTTVAALKPIGERMAELDNISASRALRGSNED
ncbi:Cyclic nucleotide-binding domain-containing protein [Roseibium hamelinense]|uniref:Cyclic nucleotide-binding domain-containing protein n=1 Tax=Roseibium hamelinense TaxID=150831 RepID=A0A562SPU3_9HYPH|nr:cyclic nucleotide-binding domain-containing protein [Roseibium hamelinense]MTI44066.1 cyclic nucleotide-binding domain-containing protein [Roseibium hamelinense]TWI82726.1 Cyclic nucleotide-binding domain-containing protein [Roseibium hamelinense]